MKKKKKKYSEKQLGLFTFIFLALTFVCMIIFTKNIEKDSISILSFFSTIIFLITGIVFLIKYLISHIKNSKSKKLEIDNANINSTDENKKSITIENGSAENTIKESITIQNDSVQNTINEQSEITPQEKAKPIQRQFVKSFNFGTDIYELKYEYDRVLIVGTKYLDEEANEIVNNLEANETIIIDRVEDNAYDPTAVGVYAMRNGRRILLGYLQKDSHFYDMFNDYFEKGNKVLAVVDISKNAALKLGYYICKKKAIEKLNSIKFSPNLSYNDDAQFALEDCEIGDECSIEYDYDKDKDVIHCHHSYIGTIPKKINDIIDSCQNYYIFIDSLETVEKDYEDKIKVKCILYYENYAKEF